MLLEPLGTGFLTPPLAGIRNGGCIDGSSPLLPPKWRAMRRSHPPLFPRFRRCDHWRSDADAAHIVAGAKENDHV